MSAPSHASVRPELVEGRGAGGSRRRLLARQAHHERRGARGWVAMAAVLAVLAAPASRAADEEPRRDEVGFRGRSPYADPGFEVPESPPRKNNTPLALGEVVGINLLLWQYSYWAGASYAKISTDTIADNFHKGWIVDTDGFLTNQFGHPYEGAAFYNAARSTGHGFYESSGIAFLGSLMWEQLMETQSPSVNDQITTWGGGSVLGEAMYRMYRLVLDSGGTHPGGWRRLGAFAISPVAGANELFFGDRYRGSSLLPPTWMGEVQAGFLLGERVKDVNTGQEAHATGPWASAAAHVSYGVPGTPDLSLRKPFDHFDLRVSVTSNTSKPCASLLIRGLVVGDTIEAASKPLGLWGLFTSYDVIGASVFKASGFGVGPGVSLVGRWGDFELQGTALAELLPWASGGSITKVYERDYHVGPGATGLLELRGLLGDRFIFDLAAREYLISGAYATGASEDIAWARAAITSRLTGPHAVSVSADWASRHARYPAHPEIFQRSGLLLAHYTLLMGW